MFDFNIFIVLYLYYINFMYYRVLLRKYSEVYSYYSPSDNYNNDLKWGKSLFINHDYCTFIINFTIV